jgi:hypothetical protein
MIVVMPVEKLVENYGQPSLETRYIAGDALLSHIRLARFVVARKTLDLVPRRGMDRNKTRYTANMSQVYKVRSFGEAARAAHISHGAQ